MSTPRTARTQQVTAADVARAAGTSTAVVSYVVNDGPRPVAAETRRRVLDAIARLGYRPNRIARALRSASSGTIGVIVPDIRIPLFGEIAAAIEEQSFRDGRLAFVANSRMLGELERAQALALVDARVEAIVVASSGPNDLGELGVPIVYIHHGPDRPGARVVRADDRSAGVLAAREIIAGSADQIVVLCPRAPIGPVRDRLRGVMAAVRAAGRSADTSTLRCPYDRAATADIVATLLDRTRPRLGVVALTDEHAVGALAALHRRGWSVPGDASVITIDGTPETATTTPPLTAVTVPIVALVTHALELVSDPTAHPSAPIPVTLVRRGSV